MLVGVGKVRRTAGASNDGAANALFVGAALLHRGAAVHPGVLLGLLRTACVVLIFPTQLITTNLLGRAAQGGTRRPASLLPAPPVQTAAGTALKLPSGWLPIESGSERL